MFLGIDGNYSAFEELIDPNEELLNRVNVSEFFFLVHFECKI